MSEKFVALVPQRIWEEGRPGGARFWESEFNIAAWVRLNARGGEAELLIRHFDAAGEHLSRVDAGRAGGEDSMLLAGVVSIRFQGPVEQVQVSLRLPDEDSTFAVDELFMQRRDSVLGRDEKLISNF